MGKWDLRFIFNLYVDGYGMVSFLIKLFYFTVVLSLTYELKIFFLFSSLDKVHLLILNMDITILTI